MRHALRGAFALIIVSCFAAVLLTGQVRQGRDTIVGQGAGSGVVDAWAMRCVNAAGDAFVACGDGAVTGAVTLSQYTPNAGRLPVLADRNWTLSAVTDSITITDGAGALNTIVDSGTITTITNPVTVTDGAGSLNVIVDSGTTAATQSGSWVVGVAGLSNDGAAVSGGPVRIGGKDGSGNAQDIMTDTNGYLFTHPATATPVTISFQESVAAGFAGVWEIRRLWTPPASSVFMPTRIATSVTTAASRSFAGTGKSLATWNENSNSFTDVASVSAPNHYSRLFAVVTTARAATANTITVTYVDDGGAGSNSATCTMPATALTAFTVIECQLATVTGPSRDTGIRDITGVSDSAAPATGIVALYGVNDWLDTLGVATAVENANYDSGVVPTTDSVILMIMQAATTAQQRGITVSGNIR